MGITTRKNLEFSAFFCDYMGFIGVLEPTELGLYFWLKHR